MNGLGIRTMSTGQVKVGRWVEGEIQNPPLEIWQVGSIFLLSPFFLSTLLFLLSVCLSLSITSHSLSLILSHSFQWI